MAQTIQELIDSLQRIEDKSQVFVGDVWTAEDFYYESDTEDEIVFTPEQLAKVADARSLGKSLGYFYEEVLELLLDTREATND